MIVFTVSQVAQTCKVSPRTVNKWVDSGLLKGFKDSECRWVRESDLNEFLVAHGRQPVENVW